MDLKNIRLQTDALSGLSAAFTEAAKQAQQFSQTYHDLMNDAASRHVLARMVEQCEEAQP